MDTPNQGNPNKFGCMRRFSFRTYRQEYSKPVKHRLNIWPSLYSAKDKALKHVKRLARKESKKLCANNTRLLKSTHLSPPASDEATASLSSAVLSLSGPTPSWSCPTSSSPRPRTKDMGDSSKALHCAEQRSSEWMGR